jgi:hypothetical protein
MPTEGKGYMKDAQSDSIRGEKYIEFQKQAHGNTM